jgi:hypothetical protein
MVSQPHKTLLRQGEASSFERKVRNYEGFVEKGSKTFDKTHHKKRRFP